MSVAGQSLRLVFAGGGTGGHLSPGIALAQEAQRQLPTVEVLFVTTGRLAERAMLSRCDFSVAYIPSAPLPTAPGALGSFATKALSGLARSFMLLSRYQPHVVVGLGSYGEAPTILAARLLGIPSVILEQNALPGKATRLLQYVADEVHVHWSITRQLLSQSRTVFVSGNPLRRQALLPTLQAKEKLGLSPGRKTLLITGGSQGASALNHAVLLNLDKLGQHVPELQFIHLTGSRDLELVSKAYAAHKLCAYVVDFLPDMNLAYSAADLVLSRAGATTLAELATWGLPSILVPLPTATDHHQHANAQVFVQASASIMLEQHHLGGQLASHIRRLLSEPDALQRMGHNALKLSQREADKKLVNRLLQLAQRRPSLRRPTAELHYEL